MNGSDSTTSAVTDSMTTSASDPSYNYYVFIKLHAALGIFAWIGLLPCAVYIARQSRQVLSGGSQKCPTWLKLHIVLFVLVVLLTAASFVFAAIPTHGYNSAGPVPSQAHQGLGLVACCLLFIGIVLSGFRMPGGQCKSKMIEKATWWIHFITGNFCLAIGATVSVIGVMRTAGPPWLILFPVGMVVFHGLMNEVIGRCVKPRPVASAATPSSAIVETQGHLQTVGSNCETFSSLSIEIVRPQNQTNGNSHHAEETEKEKKKKSIPQDLKVRKTGTIIYLTFMLPWAALFAILYPILWHPNNV